MNKGKSTGIRVPAAKAKAIDIAEEPPGVLILGTRGSALALTQSNMVAEALRKAHKGLEVRVEIIKTIGDTDQKTGLHAFPGMGVFVKELQTALLDGTIDFAVHSLKDVPEDEPEGLIFGAFPEREDPRDVFISKGLAKGKRFRDLPAGAKVGTGSPRRILQLKAIRPDLIYVPVRGNVDTRVAKVMSGELQGVVLAAAGLKRLGRGSDITHTFSFQDMIPAIGQAALGLECREKDKRTLKLLAAVHDEVTGATVTLERLFMKRIGGGCKVPMAAHVYPYGDGLRMLAVLGNPATGVMARVEQSMSADEAEDLLEEVAWRMEEECKDRGIPLPHDLPEHFLLSKDSTSESGD
jgi:hydroxymethylbilane synthase